MKDSRAISAVDDTGAGYASLAHVLELRPDIIKLDRSLLVGLDGDHARRSLIRALKRFAAEIAATLTCEGVETPAQVDALETLGVDHAQGYLLGPPTASGDLPRRWRNG